MRELSEAHERAGMPLGMDPNTQAVLEHLGYVDVRHQEIKVPYNSWPASDHEQDVGKWFNLALTEGLDAMSLAPFTRILGYAKDQVDALLEEVKKEVCDRSLKTYCVMWVPYDYACPSVELTRVLQAYLDCTKTRCSRTATLTQAKAARCSSLINAMESRVGVFAPLLTV